eukprot:jgi/Chrpa1/3332/Chrysochromulina_OHIO_Genome00016755-RA
MANGFATLPPRGETEEEEPSAATRADVAAVSVEKSTETNFVETPKLVSLRFRIAPNEEEQKWAWVYFDVAVNEEKTASKIDAPKQSARYQTDFKALPEDVLEYALSLGMEPTEDTDLLWIAEEALTAGEQEGWTEQMGPNGNLHHYNATTGQSSRQHPLDEYYQNLYLKLKMQRTMEVAGMAVPAEIQNQSTAQLTTKDLKRIPNLYSMFANLAANDDKKESPFLLLEMDDLFRNEAKTRFVGHELAPLSWAVRGDREQVATMFRDFADKVVDLEYDSLPWVVRNSDVLQPGPSREATLATTTTVITATDNDANAIAAAALASVSD